MEVYPAPTNVLLHWWWEALFSNLGIILNFEEQQLLTDPPSKDLQSSYKANLTVIFILYDSDYYSTFTNQKRIQLYNNMYRTFF